MAKNYDLNDQADQDSNDVSKINAAGLINLRVQDSWAACGRFYNQGDYDSLRDELASLWPEFYADATDASKQELHMIDRRIAYYLMQRAMNRKDKKLWVKFGNQYKKEVYKKWLFLKTMEKAQGVGKAYRDEGADEWE